MPMAYQTTLIVLLLFLLPLASPAVAQTKDDVNLEGAARAVRDLAATSTYDGLLYEIGAYVRRSWKVEGSPTTPTLTKRLSNDALARAVIPESDSFRFTDVAAAADPTILIRIAFDNRVALAERVLERVRPFLVSSLCAKGGISNELDDVSLNKVVVAVATALGFATVGGASIPVVPVVVIAVSAIIVKGGLREYCLTSQTPTISAVTITKKGPGWRPGCFDLTVMGTGFTFGSEILVQGVGSRWPTVYVTPVELRCSACWMEGVPEPKTSVVNVVTPNGAASIGHEIRW